MRQAFEGARAPALAPLPDGLHPRCVDGAARARASTRCYAHQAEALRRGAGRARRRHDRHRVGQVVVLQPADARRRCARDPKARALYLYPTKALAQDQARAIAAFRLGRHVRPAIYDGDTKREERAAIRKRSNLVLTNPDMLHMGILPNHAAWGDFFANLAVVVVDEAHVYRGVFGSHVGNVLRRLRRVAAAYGDEPRFLLASATIANPVELAERPDRAGRTSRTSTATARRARARADRDVEPAGDRRGAADAAQRAGRGGRACVTELVRRAARGRSASSSRARASSWWPSSIADQLADAHPALRDRVAPYRAGYTPQQRRELEARLVSGDLLRRRDHRRAGARHRHRRAGRRGRRDVPGDGRVAAADVGPRRAPRPRAGGLRRRRGRAGPVLLPPPRRVPRPARSRRRSSTTRTSRSTTRTCSAPRTRGRSTPTRRRRSSGPRVRAHCEHLVGGGRAGRARRARSRCAGPRTTRPRACRCARARPTRSRSSTSSQGEMLGSVDAARAFSTVHDGAVYLHMGRSYSVGELDLHGRRALVEPFTRQLVHAAQEGDRHAHRAAARPPRDDGRDAVASGWSASPRR